MPPLLMYSFLSSLLQSPSHLSTSRTYSPMWWRNTEGVVWCIIHLVFKSKISWSISCMWRYETNMKNKNSDKIIYKSQVHIWKGSNKFLRSTTIPQAKTQIIVDFLKDPNGNKKTDRIINKPQVHIWNVTGTVQTRKLWSMVIYSDMVQGSAKPSPNLAELGELYSVGIRLLCLQPIRLLTT